MVLELTIYTSTISFLYFIYHPRSLKPYYFSYINTTAFMTLAQSLLSFIYDSTIVYLIWKHEGNNYDKIIENTLLLYFIRKTIISIF